MKKIGKIKKVCSTGGIILVGEDGFYNPTPNCKQFVKKEFEGEEIELELVEGKDKIFSFIKKTNNKDYKSECDCVVEKFERNEPTDWIGKEKRIIRQNCLAHADNWYDIMQREGLLKVLSSEAILKEYLKHAMMCEKWVWSGKIELENGGENGGENED